MKATFLGQPWADSLIEVYAGLERMRPGIGRDIGEPVPDDPRESWWAWLTTAEGRAFREERPASSHAVNCLTRCNIAPKDVASYSDEELLAIRNFGRRSLAIVRRYL